MSEVERIERPPLTLYVERDRFGSALFFYLACILLPFAWTPGSAAVIGYPLWVLFAFCLINAFRLLFYQRVFSFDRDRDEVRVMERGLLRRIRRRVFSRDQMTVWILAEHDPPLRGSIMLGGSGGPEILFLRSTGKPDLLEWADRLAADLRCPLYLNVRSRVPGSESFTFERTPRAPQDPAA